MPKQYKTQDKQSIIISDTQLGSGGEGSVHQILQPVELKDYCAKIIYSHQQSQKRHDKIQFMIENIPAEIMHDNFLICWPLYMLFENDEFVGYVMPLAFNNSIELYNLTTPKLRRSLLPEWNKFDRTTKTGINNLLKLCVNIANAVYSIHSLGHYVIVDLKPQNILVATNGMISIIDMDSIEISKYKVVLHQAKVATPEYMPPEGHTMNIAKDLVPQNWDYFSVAVIFYQLLLGLHPYAATAEDEYPEATTLADKIYNNLFPFGSKADSITNLPEYHKYFEKLPQKLKDLFLRSFNHGHSKPELRPLPKEWGQTIFRLIKDGKILSPFSISSKSLSKPITTNLTEPKPVAVHFMPERYVANLDKRFAASLFDLLSILFIGILGAAVGTLLNLLILKYTIFGSIGMEGVISIAGIFVLLYFAIADSKGRTLGKSTNNTRIVDKNGDNISFGRALLRNIVKYGLLPISLISILINKKGIHDRISGSYVVDDTIIMWDDPNFVIKKKLKF